MALLRVTRLQFLAPHGVYEQERITGNRFEVDLELEYNSEAAASSDSVARSIDYGELAAIVASVMNGRPVNLIETLASRIGEKVLREFPAIDQLTVTVRKLSPEIGIPVESTEIVHTWNRP
jgi:7,8-dihydroneopterin aldolase/epimerase/oxygenase